MRSALAAALMLASCGGDRQAEVAARGAEVMPFDLDRTEHVFEKQPGGGHTGLEAEVRLADGMVSLVLPADPPRPRCSYMRQ